MQTPDFFSLDPILFCKFSFRIRSGSGTNLTQTIRLCLTSRKYKWRKQAVTFFSANTKSKSNLDTAKKIPLLIPLEAAGVRKIPNLGVWCKILSSWTSGVGQKNPTLTPPKNLRLRNPGSTGTLWTRLWHHSYGVIRGAKKSLSFERFR